MYNSAAILAFMLRNVYAQDVCKPTDCYDLKCYRISTGKDGPHTIYHDRPGEDKSYLHVSCDQYNDGGGWMIYQRRDRNGTEVEFDVDWDKYKNGFGEFGNTSTTLWMGNENVFLMLQNYARYRHECELRVEMFRYVGESVGGSVQNFQLKAEVHSYEIDWDAGSTTATHPPMKTALDQHRQSIFWTINRPQKRYCRRYKAGWWFTSTTCANFMINGRWLTNRGTYAFESIYLAYSPFDNPLDYSWMAFRPVNVNRVCNNPCKNGGACEYVAATSGYLCLCTGNFCGKHCETAKWCVSGSCVYNVATRTNNWDCVAPTTATVSVTKVTTKPTSTETTETTKTTKTTQTTETTQTTKTTKTTQTTGTTESQNVTFNATSEDMVSLEPTLGPTLSPTSEDSSEQPTSKGVVFDLLIILLLTGANFGISLYRLKKKREDAEEEAKAAEVDRVSEEPGMMSLFGW